MSDSLIDTAAEETAAPETEQRDFVVAEDSAPERPEWLPEKYKTPEDLANAYKALESKLGEKEDALREKIVQELEQKAYEGRPESKGDYQLPEYVDDATDSELLNWWADHAFENGFSQEEFEKGIEMYAQAVQGSQPNLEEEAKKLGDNANDRIQAANLFANKFFPKDALPAIERMCESHEGIIALEAIMDAVRDGGYTEGSAAPGGVTEDSLREMMQDERYWNPAKRDAGYVKQVQDGFSKLYG